MSGLLTEEQEKFFAGVIADEVPVSGLWKLSLKWTLPILVGAIDDNYGEKVPEPWANYARQLFTSTYLALQDGKFSEEEQEQIVTLCADILNKEIDIPLLEEDDEAVVFLQLLKLIASLLKKGFK